MRVLLVAAATMLAGCAGSATRPTLPDADFTGRATLICGRLDAGADLAEDRLASAGDSADDANAADARRIVAGLASTVAAARHDLADLRPPAARQANFDAYLGTLDEATSKLEAASHDVAATRRLLGAGGIASALGGLDGQEATLGLAGCARRSDPVAADARATAALGDALAAERVALAGDQAFSEAAADLALVAPDLAFEVGLVPARSADVRVKVADDGQRVYLGARSRSGTCFYVVADRAGSVGYARDDRCGPADGQDYTPSW